DILTNTPVYNDGPNDRGYRIEALLTGTGTIEYHGYNQPNFMPGNINNLNIAGSANTFSGNWNVVIGTLLGTAPNALGHGDLTVGTEGALQTTYDINNPTGNLVLNGRMYLNQNDKFRSVTVGGVALAPGTYTFAQLNASYPNNFPTSWTPQAGAEAITTGSGSLTVYGDTPPPVNLQFGLSGSNLRLSWSQGVLLEADAVTGPWTTNTTASSPFTINPTGAKKFYRVLVK
ncbi:MAG TPA: hypothetical protein VNT26_13175, partial [Candidatus Sulfotelmatobacter sp.]|nr:hypothetical protein [Candidatus Sulfotelmatobacter sp.]